MVNLFCVLVNYLGWAHFGISHSLMLSEVRVLASEYAEMEYDTPQLDGSALLVTAGG